MLESAFSYVRPQDSRCLVFMLIKIENYLCTPTSVGYKEINNAFVLVEGSMTLLVLNVCVSYERHQCMFI